MSYELIITEKPQSAKKIAEALGKPQKRNMGSVPYYLLNHKGREICVGSAVGHLYSIGTKDKGRWDYPIFDIEWKPINQLQKGSAFVIKYISTLKKLAESADEFTIACDYDIEGEVIGFNILKHICQRKDGNRMKFSTLTKEDLLRSYESKAKTIDWGQANAGLTRHELDWYYGINLSRALTHSIKAAGTFKILSAGRVQGPALKIIVDKEKEIKAFVPEPYWQIPLLGEIRKEEIEAMHEKDKFFSKEEAEKVWSLVREAKDGIVKNVERSRISQNPPFPFDLTTLQTEAYRSLRIPPKKTLELAQELYTKGLISYPRTSSQVLPESIGYRRILQELSRQSFYSNLCQKLLSQSSLKPNNGKKTDPAHPAIYPTGQIVHIDSYEAKIYDLILRRFLATFASFAIRESCTVTIDVKKENFLAKGIITVERGWHEFYGPHVKLDETPLPKTEIGDSVLIKKMDFLQKETTPPKRYTPASIIKELEKRNLGTKATRAQIVDNLFERGYSKGTSIEATPLGILTCETLEKYSPKIVDEALTRHFEEEMEKIREKEMLPEKVLSEAKARLQEILSAIKEKELDIGENLKKALIQTRDEMSFIGICPKCGKNLEIRKGKFGRFIACRGYPECRNTFNVPNTGIIKATDKICEKCKNPMIEIRRGKNPPQLVCIFNECPGKANGNGKSGTIVDKLCPKCKKNLVLRKSVYGEFYGCSGFPKCRYTEKLLK